MYNRRLSAWATGFLFGLCVSIVLADTPGEPYTLKLGVGNEDLEEQINAIPWRDPRASRTVKDVSSIDFSGRELRCSRVHFRMHGLYGANFDNCNFDGSTFKETQFVNCSFRNTSLRFCEIDGFSFGPTRMNDFTNADITGSSLFAFPAKFLIQTKNYQDKRLVGIRFRGSLRDVSFREFYLDNVSFPRSAKALDGCDFTDAVLRRMMIGRSFSEQQLRATKNYQNKDLSELLFVGTSRPKYRVAEGEFAGWDFSECILAYFMNCNLTDARFDNAYFLNTVWFDVWAVSSPKSDFSLSDYYTMVRLADIGFDGCVLTESQFRQTANWKRKDLRGMHLRNMVLDGWDFSGLDMDSADLSGSSLNGANFTGASISGVRLENCDGLTVDQILQSHTCRLRTRLDIVRAWSRVDFVDLTDEEKVLQAEVRRRNSNKP